MKNGWQIKRLGEVCEIVKGRKPELKETQSTGDMPYLVAKVMRGSQEAEYASISDKNSITVCETDTIIICDGSNSGEVFTGFNGILSSTMGKVAKKAEINEAYLRAFLSSTFDAFNGAKTGAAIPHLDKEAMYALEFPLPPLPEQQRIVSVLDEAFLNLTSAQLNAERNLQNARELFESHLQSIFTQRGSGWIDRQLASLCREITVGHVGSMKAEYKESGVPFLRSQNIRPFEVSMDNAMFISDKFHRALKKSQLRPGDVAIVRTGYPGTAAVIPPELPDSNCSDLVIVRPGEQVNPHFLAAFFNSSFGKLLVLGKIVGAAQKHFNITAAKEVMLHVPPMSEQARIVEEIGLIRIETQRLENLYRQKQAALVDLKKSLLHQAFSGQLGVAA